MKEHNNPNQWGDSWPSLEKIKEDRELDAKRTVEFEESLVYENAMELFDKDSILSRPYKKSLEYIKNITPSTLEKAYRNILNIGSDNCFILSSSL